MLARTARGLRGRVSQSMFGWCKLGCASRGYCRCYLRCYIHIGHETLALVAWGLLDINQPTEGKPIASYQGWHYQLWHRGNLLE